MGEKSVKAKQLKEQCNQIACALDLPPAWSIPDLASRLSALSGRPVHIDLLPQEVQVAEAYLAGVNRITELDQAAGWRYSLRQADWAPRRAQ
jgi:hypothetical protein